MPNWCENQTYAYGKIENIKAFIDPIKEGLEAGDYQGFLNHYYPCPQELKDTTAAFINPENPIPDNWINFVKDGSWTQEEYDKRAAEAIASAEKQKSNIEKYGYSDWYHWCIDNWGSKWGDCDLVVEDIQPYGGDGYGFVQLRYDSAWGPNNEGITEISKLFPKLLFDSFYREEGMGFLGHFQVHNGDVLNDETGSTIPTAHDYEYRIDFNDDDVMKQLV